jgi:hypothetical protein
LGHSPWKRRPKQRGHKPDTDHHAQLTSADLPDTIYSCKILHCLNNSQLTIITNHIAVKAGSYITMVSLTALLSFPKCKNGNSRRQMSNSAQQTYDPLESLANRPLRLSEPTRYPQSLAYSTSLDLHLLPSPSWLPRARTHYRNRHQQTTKKPSPSSTSAAPDASLWSLWAISCAPVARTRHFRRYVIWRRVSVETVSLVLV